MQCTSWHNSYIAYIHVTSSFVGVRVQIIFWWKKFKYKVEKRKRQFTSDGKSLHAVHMGRLLLLCANKKIKQEKKLVSYGLSTTVSRVVIFPTVTSVVKQGNWFICVFLTSEHLVEKDAAKSFSAETLRKSISIHTQISIYRYTWLYLSNKAYERTVNWTLLFNLPINL